MNKHFKYTKGLHVLTLCCFLMPFFYTSCDKSKSGEIEEVVMEMDTTSKVEDSNSDGEDFNKFLSTANDSIKNAVMTPFLKTIVYLKDYHF